MKNYELIFFGGSGARICSHLGAALYLEDNKITAKEYGGISGGLIIATFLALGMIDEVKNEIIQIKSKDVFWPNVFDSCGNLRVLPAAIGFLRHGPDAISNLNPLRKKLLALNPKKWHEDLRIFGYIYGDSGLSRLDSKGKTWAEWVEILITASSFPLLSICKNGSDAGIVRQLPLISDIKGDSIAFLTLQSQTERSPIQKVIQRVGLDNLRDERKILEGHPIEVVMLPSKNKTTEYQEDLMLASFQASYSFSRKYFNL